MIDPKGKRMMVYPGPTDFRYGINGLSLLVGKRAEGVVYAFCGKSGKSLKFLEFEKDAAWLPREIGLLFKREREWREAAKTSSDFGGHFVHRGRNGRQKHPMPSMQGESFIDTIE